MPPRRLFCERGLAICKEMQGERHPDYASGLSNLAKLNWASGRPTVAAPLIEQAMEIYERQLKSAASYQSERQQLEMTRKLHRHLDVYLTLVPPGKISAAGAYGHLLSFKGAVFEQQRRVAMLRGLARAEPNTETARLFADLDETSRRLATLILTNHEKGPEKLREGNLVINAVRDQLGRRSGETNPEKGDDRGHIGGSRLDLPRRSGRGAPAP